MGARARHVVWDRRRSKYGAKRTVVDGVSFASRKEARRYEELRLLEREELIVELTLQPRFPILVAPAIHVGPAWTQVAPMAGAPATAVGSYVADFAYYVAQTGEFVVEDVKGMPGGTETYRLKKRLVEAQYGFQIQER